MKNTTLLPGALSIGFAIVTSSAFAQAPADKEMTSAAEPEMTSAAKPEMSSAEKSDMPSTALMTDPENPVVIAEDDAKEMRKEMSKEPFDMETLRGKTYKDCKVLKVDPDGLFFRHSRGMAKLSFEDLSEDIRDRFDYKPEMAKQFVKKHMDVMAEVAKRREQQPTIIINNQAPQNGGFAGFGGIGGGIGSSSFGFPFGFPFGIPRSDAAAPFFGFPNVSFQAGVEQRPGSPIAPGLISQNRFQRTQDFVQGAAGFRAPGRLNVSNTRLGAVGPGTFSPPPQIFTSPRPVNRTGLGGIRPRRR